MKTRCATLDADLGTLQNRVRGSVHGKWVHGAGRYERHGGYATGITPAIGGGFAQFTKHRQMRKVVPQLDDHDLMNRTLSLGIFYQNLGTPPRSLWELAGFISMGARLARFCGG